MCFCNNDDGNLSLILSDHQNLGFEKLKENSCDL